MYRTWHPGELRIIDIALLPEQRDIGIGTWLVNALIQEADEHGADVTLYVEAFNRARRLYQRLGFETIEDSGAYLFMRRRLGEASGQLKTAS